MVIPSVVRNKKVSVNTIDKLQFNKYIYSIQDYVGLEGP